MFRVSASGVQGPSGTLRGRALRGEAFVRGVDRIHERVSAEIDDKPFESEIAVEEAPSGKSVRPLAGAAVAATVALVAIFGLQQTIGVDDGDTVTANGTFAENEPGYTVPRPIDDQLRQYYLSHGATATENGANGINSRFVALRFSEEALQESSAGEESAPEDVADDGPTQP